MKEEIRETSSLLRKNETASDDVRYNENRLLGGDTGTAASVIIDSAFTTGKVFTKKIGNVGNANYIDFCRKIGLESEFIGDSLTSYSQRIKKEPYLAKLLIQEIIEKDITENESAYIDLFDVLCSNHMEAEALSFIIYAYMKLNEKVGVGEEFYVSAVAFGTFSKRLGAIQFAYYLVQQIAKDKNAERYMSVKMYSVICKYYLKRLEAIPWRDKEGVFFSEGIRWARKMIEFQKTNENGYFWFASFLLEANRRDEAERSLRSSIYDPPDPDRDSFARLQCPKCCKLYLEEFRGSISFPQLKEIVLKGLNDCIVFKSDESSEYIEYKMFFQDQLHKLDVVLKTNYCTEFEREDNYG